MLKSLVADYDSSSGEEDPPVKSSGDVPLASATEMLSSVSNITSVFSNPYQEAEDYEKSILEKHVKMTSVKKMDVEKKKICYKYFKGKCKHGDNCRFVHHNPHQEKADNNSDDANNKNNKPSKTKKRCGLKDDLVPPKKFMKSLNLKTS